ncbi:hypothetical protein L861_14555 [Litchfieldella anticariensis FP35 = DSM 16096]|uniref:Uncharacterized protein n=1 Tax=Litchfieldella anticariensis (strain DSM 16096 / CECT 5854 / CIP 108499 / LMG 22089 / FP35) TaxID=1121939 RepID=S2KD74_LITA3|nr:hypothetical protein L861_14555 [Halomonas anticariensis FP35 = DSM 16096]
MLVPAIAAVIAVSAIVTVGACLLVRGNKDTNQE